MKITLAPFLLQFKFDAGTSRGVLKTRKSWIVRLEIDGFVGQGEVAPLKGLSLEGYEGFEPQLIKELHIFKKLATTDLSGHEYLFSSSTLFGLECALLELKNKEEGHVFRNDFVAGKEQIPINGLVWMGNSSFMKTQIEEKLKQGFSCIKMKVGAIDFEEEYKLLQQLRSEFPAKQLTLRVDANGAFSFDEAQKVLGKLQELDIHSIEQPIKAGQIDEMEQLCQLTSSVGIALDEELIGVRETSEKEALLDKIKPQYIILKPTLHGGLSGTKEWIRLAEKRNIDWWITSALESNIGLNAICQLTNEYRIGIPQGLGTGSLYTNNIPSPLEVNGEFISYNTAYKWDYSQLNFQEI